MRPARSGVPGPPCIRIPEIDVLAKVSRREEAEMTAREHIAVSIGVPSADVAVQVVGES
jgi:hypothetical protein